jgi:hypothetical protein
MKDVSRTRRLLRALGRRVAPTNAMGALTLCTLFGALLAAGVYFTREFEVLKSANGPRTAGDGRSASDPQMRGLDAADPVVRFAETRIGHLLFESRAGDNCRRVLFDNRSGGSAEVADIYCGYETAPAAGGASGVDRIMILRKSFQK